MESNDLKQLTTLVKFGLVLATLGWAFGSWWICCSSHSHQFAHEHEVFREHEVCRFPQQRMNRARTAMNAARFRSCRSTLWGRCRLP